MAASDIRLCEAQWPFIPLPYKTTSNARSRVTIRSSFRTSAAERLNEAGGKLLRPLSYLRQCVDA